jgi:hypothetical protein
MLKKMRRSREQIQEDSWKKAQDRETEVQWFVNKTLFRMSWIERWITNTFHRDSFIKDIEKMVDENREERERLIDMQYGMNKIALDILDKLEGKTKEDFLKGLEGDGD